jgi:hypothetical protein
MAASILPTSGAAGADAPARNIVILSHFNNDHTPWIRSN